MKKDFEFVLNVNETSVCWFFTKTITHSHQRNLVCF